MLHQYRTFGSDGDYATTLELALERANLANPLNGNLNPKTDKDLKSELQRATEYLNQGTLD